MFDESVISCFLENQLQLFPEEVASNPEDAQDFLEEVMAVVVKGKKGVLEYFLDEGVDMTDEDILEAAEVFDIGDGRFLIVEA